jgi:hypothetical protein
MLLPVLEVIMSKKITVDRRGLLLGRYYSPSQGASEVDGKLYGEKKERWLFIICFGKGVDDIFFEDKVQLIEVAVTEESNYRANCMQVLDCEIDYIFGRTKVVRIDGYEVVSI